MTKVLWLDDNLGSYNFILRTLKEKGLNISAARTTEEATRLLTEEFDVYLLDIKLAENSDGVKFAEIIKASHPDASLVFLSAYLHQEYWRNRLEKIDSPAGILEKDFTGDIEAVADNLAAQIKSWARREAKYKPADYYAWKLEAVDMEPFKIGKRRFEDLPEYQQDQLTIKARKEAADAINSAFADGAVWVLMSGSRLKPLEVRYSIEDIPDERELRDITRDLKHAYYEFQRNYGAEGLAWAGPCSSSDLSGYPALTLILEDMRGFLGEDDDEGSAATITRKRIHFDTGSAETLLDYEMLVEFGLLQPNRRRTHMQRAETKQDFFAFHHDLSILFEEDSQTDPSRSVGVMLRVLAVRDWWNSPWTRLCGMGCSAGKDLGGALYCQGRCGLIGRNLLTHGKVTVELNGVTGGVKVRKHDIS